jgi:hypothetical protein
MPPFAFRFAFLRRGLVPAAPVPSADVLARYLVQRHLAGDTVRDIASELELPEHDVQSALLDALHLR